MTDIDTIFLVLKGYIDEFGFKITEINFSCKKTCEAGSYGTKNVSVLDPPIEIRQISVLRL